MAKIYSVLPNLIDQVQILLKKEAGFDSFNFDDHSLDSPSSSLLEEAIVGSNLSADALRCKNCRGELLQGPDSIICVYCGQSQLQDSLPQSISFSSTFACQWFLKSLDLDEFEKVGIPLCGDRGRSLVKEEKIPLSDLLNLTLKWRGDLRGFGVENEGRVPRKRFLSLVGVDIEEILGQESSDHAISARNEEVVVSKNIENEESRIEGERSLSLFENTLSTERSGVEENDDSFSDWGAQFQSAIPDSRHQKSTTTSIADASSGSILNTSNDHWSDLDSGPFNLEVFDANSVVEGGVKAIEPVDAAFDCLPAYQRSTTQEDCRNIEKRDGDDSFDDCGDFRMSMSDNITQCEPYNTVVPGAVSSAGQVASDPFDYFTSFVVSKGIQHPNDSLKGPDDALNNFTSPSAGGDIWSQTISDKPELHVGTGDPALGGDALGGDIDLALLDGNYGGHQGINVDRNQNKISDHGDSTGLWSNDINLGIKGELDLLPVKEIKTPGSGTKNEIDDSLGLWNDFKGTDAEIVNNMATEDVSTIDTWNDFAAPGVGKKDFQANSLEVIDGEGNGNQDSLALCYDDSLDAWSGFAGSSGVFDSKPVNNDISSGVWNDFPGITASYANQPQSSNRRTSEDQAALEDDNLFSSWGDFRSSGPNDAMTSSDQINSLKAPNSLKKIDDNSTYSMWGDFGGSTSHLERQADRTESSEKKLSSGAGDLFSGFSDSGLPNNQLQCLGVTINGESTHENDDSFVAWTDFTSSNNEQANLSSSVNALDDKGAVKHGDLFDAWNVMVGLPNVQAGKDTAAAMVKAPETDIFNHIMNSKYVGPNSSMPLDLNVGMFGLQNGSASVAFSPPEDLDLARTENVDDIKADGNVSGVNPSESTSKESLDQKSSVVETLILEMHDLSFMLESNLSTPNSGR